MKRSRFTETRIFAILNQAVLCVHHKDHEICFCSSSYSLCLQQSDIMPSAADNSPPRATAL